MYDLTTKFEGSFGAIWKKPLKENTTARDVLRLVDKFQLHEKQNNTWVEVFKAKDEKTPSDQLLPLLNNLVKLCNCETKIITKEEFDKAVDVKIDETFNNFLVQ